MNLIIIGILIGSVFGAIGIIGLQQRMIEGDMHELQMLVDRLNEQIKEQQFIESLEAS